jgi:hypothetical protein
MKPKAAHKPGKSTTECPSDLETLADTLKHPEIIRTGITCTENGHWALYVSVPKDSDVPIAELDSLAFPVVYVAEPDEPIRAQKN